MAYSLDVTGIEPILCLSVRALPGTGTHDHRCSNQTQVALPTLLTCHQGDTSELKFGMGTYASISLFILL